MSPSTPSHGSPAQVLRERLLDDDGPVLVKLREEIGASVEARGWCDDEGVALHPNDRSVEALGNEVSGRVKTALDSIFEEAILPDPSHGNTGEREWTIYVCPECGKRHGGQYFCRCAHPASRATGVKVVPAAQLDQVREERDYWQREVGALTSRELREKARADKLQAQVEESIKRERSIRETFQKNYDEKNREIHKLQARVEELEGSLTRLQMGPDTLTQAGLRIVLDALYPDALATSPPNGEEPALVLSTTLEVAKANDFCPVCECYGGGEAPEGHEDSDCSGVCPKCWCPGCHDGHDFPGSRIGELDDGDPCGSWLAFELIHGPNPTGARVHPRPAPEVSQDCGGELTAEQRQVMKAAADEYGAKLQKLKGNEPNHDPVGGEERCPETSKAGTRCIYPAGHPLICAFKKFTFDRVTDGGDGR